MNYSIQPVGHIKTPFQQKFSIPRQAQGVSIAKGHIDFCDHIDAAQALDGIQDFSNLWLVFVFHENIAQGFKAKVRPPRLGGNKKVGVFASRSSFRPNALGLSLVRNLGVKNNQLHVAELDLLNNTPIMDIKPYLPYADIATNASTGYAPSKPEQKMQVTYSQQAQQELDVVHSQYPDFAALLAHVLGQDPRPAYKKQQVDNKVYHVSLYDIDVHWCINETAIHVLNMNKV